MLKYCSEDGAQKPVSFQASKPDFFHGSRTEIRRFHWVCWWEEISSECPQSCQMVGITLHYFSALFSKKISPRCSHPQATLNKRQCIWHSLCRKSMTDCLLLLLWHWQWLFSFKAGALPVMNGKSDCRVWSLLRADSSYHLIIWGNFLKGLSLVKQDVFLSGALQWLLMAKKEKEPRDLQFPVCHSKHRNNQVLKMTVMDLLHVSANISLPKQQILCAC